MRRVAERLAASSMGYEEAVSDREGLWMWTAEARRRYAWTRRKGGPRLTDPEWALLEPLLPRQASLGRPWKHALRAIPPPLASGLRVERAARLGAAAQHGVRVV
ncbi:MAG: putative transposase of family [Geminicoccaceae bacterium]|nr:putative transposase of family [Geminicoccaceae bacterium]